MKNLPGRVAEWAPVSIPALRQPWNDRTEREPSCSGNQATETAPQGDMTSFYCMWCGRGRSGERWRSSFSGRGQRRCAEVWRSPAKRVQPRKWGAPGAQGTQSDPQSAQPALHADGPPPILTTICRDDYPLPSLMEPYRGHKRNWQKWRFWTEH